MRKNYAKELGMFIKCNFQWQRFNSRHILLYHANYPHSVFLAGFGSTSAIALTILGEFHVESFVKPHPVTFFLARNIAGSGTYHDADGPIRNPTAELDKLEIDLRFMKVLISFF